MAPEKFKVHRMTTAVRRRVFPRPKTPDINDDTASTKSKRSIKDSIKGMKIPLFRSSRDRKETIPVPIIEETQPSPSLPSLPAIYAAQPPLPVHFPLVQTPVLINLIDVPVSNRLELNSTETTSQGNIPPSLMGHASTDDLDGPLQPLIISGSSFLPPESAQERPPAPASQVPVFSTMVYVGEGTVGADAPELRDKAIVLEPNIESVVSEPPPSPPEAVVIEPPVEAVVTELPVMNAVINNAVEALVMAQPLMPTQPTSPALPVSNAESYFNLTEPDDRFIEVPNPITEPMDWLFADNLEHEGPQIVRDPSVGTDLAGRHISAPLIPVSEYAIEPKENTVRSISPALGDGPLISDPRIEALHTELLIEVATTTEPALEVPATQQVLAAVTPDTPPSPDKGATPGPRFNVPLPDEEFVSDAHVVSGPMDVSFNVEPDKPHVVSDSPVIHELGVHSVETEPLVNDATIEYAVMDRDDTQLAAPPSPVSKDESHFSLPAPEESFTDVAQVVPGSVKPSFIYEPGERQVEIANPAFVQLVHPDSAEHVSAPSIAERPVSTRFPEPDTEVVGPHLPIMVSSTAERTVEAPVPEMHSQLITLALPVRDAPDVSLTVQDDGFVVIMPHVVKEDTVEALNRPILGGGSTGAPTPGVGERSQEPPRIDEGTSPGQRGSYIRSVDIYIYMVSTVHNDWSVNQAARGSIFESMDDRVSQFGIINVCSYRDRYNTHWLTITMLLVVRLTLHDNNPTIHQFNRMALS
jgi:hypothetical protein